jgi:hypothetical protein
MFILTTVILNFMTDLVDIKQNPVSEVHVIHYYKDKRSYKALKEDRFARADRLCT